MRLLGILRDRTPGMLELARFLDLEKSSITGLVDRAERRGLVQRSTTPEDGRALRVSLTPQGHHITQAFATEVGRQVDLLVVGLNEVDRKRLASLASYIVLQDGDARRAVSVRG